jgi:uncharacterized integral membrane protein
VVHLGLVLLVLCLVFGTGLVLSNADSVSAEAFGVSFADLSVGGLFLLGAATGALEQARAQARGGQRPRRAGVAG